MEVESVPGRGMMVLKGGVCRRLCDVSEGRAEKEKKVNRNWVSAGR